MSNISPQVTPCRGIEADIGRDPEEPRLERCTALESISTSPGAEQCLLNQVLGVLEGADHPIAMQVELPAIPLRQAPNSD